MKKNIHLVLFSFFFALIFSFEQTDAQRWQTSGNALVGNEILGSTNNFPLNIVTNNLTRVTVLGNPNGFVGIGSPAPTPNAQLHVNSLAGKSALRVQVDGTTKLFVHSGGGVAIGSSANPPVNGLFVSGFAGIGITSPGVKLHVVGGTDASATGGGYIVAGSTSGANVVIDENEIMARTDSTASDLFLNHNGGNVIIDGTNAAGNVGIGLTDPIYKLHVNGNIFAHGSLDLTSYIRFGSIEKFSDGGDNTIETNSSIIPDGDAGRDIGSPARDWRAIYAVSYLTPSPQVADERTQNLQAGLREIMKLRPVSYANGDVLRFGLISKEVQQVLPEATRDWQMVTDETGNTMKKAVSNVSLEYDAIIPVLIKGMQQQQELITALQQRVTELESKLNSSATDQIKNAGSLSAIALEQNQPNPFSQSTIIRYHLPQGNSGVINIYSEDGILIKSFKTNDSGQATINAYDLKAGTYTYTLSVNSRIADSKKMVLVK